MATVFHGLGAAMGLTASNSFDCKKLLLPSRRSFLGSGFILNFFERKASLLLVRSDGSGNLNVGSNSRARRAEQLITNAVATKADNSAPSTASKSGDRFMVLLEAVKQSSLKCSILFETQIKIFDKLDLTLEACAMMYANGLFFGVDVEWFIMIF
ncbi:hypothetical protein GH714_005285 [Hevea brasiliensis]|uniref:Uncharacterized protein n=1 Tax=Hevea brasiliensis TaxID=3981 RepID=A0A6A6LYY3_HEVBR|nr:hypothetical protein GH714_005285 [Hevea brasiliensis]